MGPHFRDDSIWELGPIASRTESPLPADRKHSSSASTSSASTENPPGTPNSNGSRGRRTRPSVSSAQSKLPTVREQRDQQRALSLDVGPSQEGPPRLASDETVVSSNHVLTNFERVAARNHEGEVLRQKQLQRYNTENNRQQSVYERLKRWADTEFRDIKHVMLSLALDSYKREPLPRMEELVKLAHHYYPPRGQLKVQVCDFGEGRAEHKEITLGEVEECWQQKPEWADVRWIHAPLGLGLTHSSIEDIFLHDGSSGRAFEKAGRSGWPYLETEILNFRSEGNFQEMRDVYVLLKNLDDLRESLDESIWNGDKNASLQSDIDWRADHLGTKVNYWNMVDSDMPWQLSEGLCMGGMGPTSGLKPVVRHIDRQAISQHPFYRTSQLVRNPLRCFHRSDGFLLTLSPMAGVNYLDKNFSKHIAEPIDAMWDNENASAIGHVFRAFADQGSSTWHRRTIEWFVTYLITEVGVTPHHLRAGCSAPAVEEAYSSVIQDLKRRRYEPWRKDETVKLVRDYLACIDELTTIKLSLQKKLGLFKGLQEDVNKFETDDILAQKQPDNPLGESCEDRVAFALNMVKEQHDCFERLLIDCKQSMDAVCFQLPSSLQRNLTDPPSSCSNCAPLSKTNSPSSPTPRTKLSSSSLASPSCFCPSLSSLLTTA